MLLHSAVEQVLHIEPSDRRATEARVIGVAAVLVHQVLRWVGLLADEVALVSTDAGVGEQRVGGRDAHLEVGARENELGEIQHVRRQELAVAVEVAPHPRHARVARLKSSAWLPRLREQRHRDCSRERSSRATVAPARVGKSTPGAHQADVPRASHHGRVLDLTLHPARRLDQHAHDLALHELHSATHHIERDRAKRDLPRHGRCGARGAEHHLAAGVVELRHDAGEGVGVDERRPAAGVERLHRQVAQLHLERLEVGAHGRPDVHLDVELRRPVAVHELQPGELAKVDIHRLRLQVGPQHDRRAHRGVAPQLRLDCELFVPVVVQRERAVGRRADHFCSGAAKRHLILRSNPRAEGAAAHVAVSQAALVRDVDARCHARVELETQRRCVHREDP